VDVAYVKEMSGENIFMIGYHDVKWEKINTIRIEKSDKTISRIGDKTTKDASFNPREVRIFADCRGYFSFYLYK
jgi:hypothetical protein